MEYLVQSDSGHRKFIKSSGTTQDVKYPAKLTLDETGSLVHSPTGSCKVYSPVTDLAMNLGGLTTLSSHVKEDTPKRRLSLSLCDGMTPTPPPFQSRSAKPTLTRQLSVDEGCCVDSPSPIEEDQPLYKTLKNVKKSNPDFLKKDGFQSPAMAYTDVPSAAFRRFQAMPVPFCGFDPSPPATRREVRLSDKLQRDLSPDNAATPRRSHLFSPDKPLFNLCSPSKTSFCADDDDENSQDSGVCMDKQDSGCAEFKCPVAPAPRPRKLSIGTDNAMSSPLKYSSCSSSSPKCTASMPLHFSKSLFKQSPVKLQKSPFTSHFDEDGDDGFMELLDVDEENKDRHCRPKGLENLFSAPMLAKQEDTSTTPLGFLKTNRTLADVTNTGGRNSGDSNSNSGFRRGLFSSSSPNLQKLTRSQTFSFSTKVQQKRRSESFVDDESCSSSTTPRMLKRRKSVYDEENKENCDRNNTVAYKASFNKKNANNATAATMKPKLHRCHSESEALVKAALEKRDNLHLIGDLSREHALPIIKGKHQDLRSIDADTMADLLNGVYKHVVEKFVIIDCRYPYEYEGGHIKGAKNMYTKEEIYNEFIKSSNFKQPASEGKRNILIFHCEFSSERGPKMSRFLRSQDREVNKDLYPHLDYPEVYLLDQGYKKFFETHRELCVPEEYKLMLDENHSEDLRHFRAKSKSWAGDCKNKGKGRISFRSLKF